MPKSLQESIEALASQFARDLLSVLRNASLEELSQVTAEAHRTGGRRAGRRRADGDIVGVPKGKRTKTGRLSRRSADDIGAMVSSIASLLDRHPEGLRAEQIRSALSVDPRELPRPLAEALSSKKISKTGQKRATTYFAKGLVPTVKVAKAKKRGQSKSGQPKSGKKREETGASDSGSST